MYYMYVYKISELGTSLFEIAQSLFALERTLILGAMALLETKSEVQRAKRNEQSAMSKVQ